MKLAHDNGFRKFYFRGVGGHSYYDSKVRTKYAGGDWRPQTQKLVRTIAAYDPVAEHIKACHELGMELYYWDPIFDNYPFARLYPGMKGYEEFGPCPAGGKAVEASGRSVLKGKETKEK